MTVTVLVVDDHQTFVRTLGVMLTSEGYDVVGTAFDGESAVEQCLALQPDVVMMDIQMPGIGGIEATRQIVDAAPQIAVIVLTMFDGDDSVAMALRAGARGYLVKGARQDEIRRTVEMVLDGHAVISRSVVKHLPGIARERNDDGHAYPFPSLTSRERDVLQAMADGFDNDTISQRLYLSQKTVRNYVSSVLTKLQVPTRSKAIVAARTNGIGSTPDA